MCHCSWLNCAMLWARRRGYCGSTLRMPMRKVTRERGRGRGGRVIGSER